MASTPYRPGDGGAVTYRDEPARGNNPSFEDRAMSGWQTSVGDVLLARAPGNTILNVVAGVVIVPYQPAIAGDEPQPILSQSRGLSVAPATCHRP